MKTFAEILREHSALCSKAIAKAKKIIDNARTSSNSKARDIQLDKAEKIIDSVGEAFRLFEVKHGKELTAIQNYLEQQKKG